MRIDDPTRAEQVYVRLIPRAKNALDAAALESLLAWLHLKENKIDLALNRFQSAWKFLGKDRTRVGPACAAGLAFMAFESGEIESAESYLECFERLHEGKKLEPVATAMYQFWGAPNCRAGGELSARGYLSIAEAFFVARCWNQAIICYQRAIEHSPTLIDAHRGLGDAFFAQGVTRKAMACYERAIEIEPSDAAAYRYLGHAHFRLGKLPEAIKATEQALQIDPNYVQASSQLSELRKTEADGGLPPDFTEWPV